MMVRWLLSFFLLGIPHSVLADGPGDNIPEKVRPIPPAGISVPDKDRQALNRGLALLDKQIADLSAKLKGKAALVELLPDVLIFRKAVRYALTLNEFHDPQEFKKARALLLEGMRRADDLAAGKAPWTTQTGLVVRGYRSRIDDSVQPYGLVVPESYRPNARRPYRLDVWCHGRNETLTEVNFLDDRQRSKGPFAPAHAFVLHPYGRYCNASKFAGEVDVLEALAHVRKHYRIDADRLVMRGFSMGGASCWHFAVHYPGIWAAAAPGAGFSETPDFLKNFQKENLRPTWYEKKLWHWYDCTDYAVNLFNCPVVAYSGELDIQKQAADMMEKAMAAEGLTLVHLIGPGIKHDYHPRTKEEINRRIDRIARRGRDPLPNRVRFTTWTLRYNRARWVTIDGMGEHWKRARMDAEIVDRHTIKVKTENVTAFTLSMPSGSCPLDTVGKPRLLLDGQDVIGAPVLSDRSWVVHCRKVGQSGSAWRDVKSPPDGKLAKLHGLQGPIDDAFLDRFLMVRPTDKPLREKVGKWTKEELAHAIYHWRKQFRGEARVKHDDAVTEADIADSNLILWGDPQSNKVLARIAAKLPIRWDARAIRVGKQTFPAGHHALAMIYPNPLNPKRYVVLNSGFTYREYDYLNNARQVPKLPDFAVVDVNVLATTQAPGKIVDAGFFGERWELQGGGK
jgi:hypothetical protein